MSACLDTDKETRVIADAIAEARRLVASDSYAHLSALESIVRFACQRIADNPPAERGPAVTRLKALVSELDDLARELERRQGRDAGTSRGASSADAIPRAEDVHGA